MLSWNVENFEQTVKGLKKDWSVYDYGDLRITVSGNTIVYIKRLSERNGNFVFNQRKYEKISKRLGLKY
ncbi:hypothetical protein D3C79_1079450 [compost metagenome]